MQSKATVDKGRYGRNDGRRFGLAWATQTVVLDMLVEAGVWQGAHKVRMSGVVVVSMGSPREGDLARAGDRLRLDIGV